MGWPFYMPLLKTIGNVNKYDGDGNENVKKAIGLVCQNNFVRASLFFVLSLPSLRNYDGGGREHKTTFVFFS